MPHRRTYSMQYCRSPTKNAQYCSAGLLDRDRLWPTQRLSAWRISITPVPSPLRLGSGACGCHGRAQALVMPKTTYCSNPALSEIPKIGGPISVLVRRSAGHARTRARVYVLGNDLVAVTPSHANARRNRLSRGRQYVCGSTSFPSKPPASRAMP